MLRPRSLSCKGLKAGRPTCFASAVLEHSRLIFNFHRQHKAICSSTAIVILLPFGFVWINAPCRCRVGTYGCVAFLVQGDKPASSP